MDSNIVFAHLLKCISQCSHERVSFRKEKVRQPSMFHVGCIRHSSNNLKSRGMEGCMCSMFDCACKLVHNKDIHMVHKHIQ